MIQVLFSLGVWRVEGSDKEPKHVPTHPGKGPFWSSKGIPPTTPGGWLGTIVRKTPPTD